MYARSRDRSFHNNVYAETHYRLGAFEARPVDLRANLVPRDRLKQNQKGGVNSRLDEFYDRF